MDVRADLDRMAELAQLRLTAAELDAVAAYIEAAIARMPSLVTDDDAALSVPVPRLRPDESGADPLLEPPAVLAPAWRDGFFMVTPSRPQGPDG
jgi:hypothetical protein